MKRRALNIYHIINASHLLFYLYMAIQVLNIGNLRSLMQGNLRMLLFVYIGIIIVLGFYAKSIDKTVKNPISTVTYARYLHFIAIAVFVLGAIGSVNIRHDMIYLVFLSFPLDLLAFILAFKGTQDERKVQEDLLDDFDLEE